MASSGREIRRSRVQQLPVGRWDPQRPQTQHKQTQHKQTQHPQTQHPQSQHPQSRPLGMNSTRHQCRASPSIARSTPTGTWPRHWHNWAGRWRAPPRQPRPRLTLPPARPGRAADRRPVLDQPRPSHAIPDRAEHCWAACRPTGWHVTGRLPGRPSARRATSPQRRCSSAPRRTCGPRTTPLKGRHAAQRPPGCAIRRPSERRPGSGMTWSGSPLQLARPWGRDPPTTLRGVPAPWPSRRSLHRGRQRPEPATGTIHWTSLSPGPVCDAPRGR